MTRRGIAPRHSHEPALVIVVSDLHCGSTLGLIDPDGGYDATREGRWLWERWLAFVRECRIRARRRRVYLVLNGDLIDGKVKQTYQVYTDSRTEQRRIAQRVLAPLVELSDVRFVIRGTAAHTGHEAEDEEQLGQDLGAEQTKDGKWSWWELQAELGGVLLDVSHHVGGSAAPWTAGGPAVRLASRTLMEYAGRGERVPALVVRSHIHHYHDSYQNVPGCRGIVLPAWQLRTEYGYRTARPISDIGGLIVKARDGEVEDVTVVRYPLDKRHPWRER